MNTKDLISAQRGRNLIEKLRRLPADRIAEIEDFIDFLYARQEARRLANASSRLSEAAFHEVWDNPDDADYDRL